MIETCLHCQLLILQLKNEDKSQREILGIFVLTKKPYNYITLLSTLKYKQPELSTYTKKHVKIAPGSLLFQSPPPPPPPPPAPVIFLTPGNNLYDVI